MLRRETSEALTCWTLARLCRADKVLAEQGQEFRAPDSWWAPGMGWAKGSERHGLHLSVFTMGVGVMASGDPELGRRILREFREEEGEEAADWLTDAWRHIRGLVDDDLNEGLQG